MRGMMGARKEEEQTYPRRLNHPFLRSSSGTGDGQTRLWSHLTFLVDIDINLGLPPELFETGTGFGLGSWGDVRGEGGGGGRVSTELRRETKAASGGDRDPGGETEKESRRGR